MNIWTNQQIERLRDISLRNNYSINILDNQILLVGTIKGNIKRGILVTKSNFRGSMVYTSYVSGNRNEFDTFDKLERYLEYGILW